MNRRSPLLLATLVAVSACADQWVSSSDSAIVGGTADTGDPAVGAVLIQMSDGTTVAICSGTLISKKVVMTAAHCVSIHDPQIPGAAPKQVFFGSNVDGSPVALINVTKTTFHPSFNERRLQDGNDVALLLLEREPPSGITPMPINRQAMTSHIGESVRLVGFGITSGGMHDDGTKRMVTTNIDDVDAKLLWVMDPNRNTCNGDSGGPSFVNIGGREVVAGVTSFGDEDCIQAGAYTRVDLFASSFIDPWIAENDATPAASCGRDNVCTMGCTPVDPDCSAAEPPPKCVADGQCVAACGTATPDPDCAGPGPGMGGNDGNGGGPGITSSDEGVDGGCAVGRGSESALGMLIVLLGLVVARRRASV